jgi:ribonuclease P protein component
MHTDHLTFRIAKRNPNFKTLSPKQIPNSNVKNSQNLQTTNYNLTPRFGFVISNKIDKRATRRNALKRHIRAVIEEKLVQIPNGTDVVVQVKKPFDYPYDYRVIKEEVLFGLMRLGIIKRENNNPL